MLATAACLLPALLALTPVEAEYAGTRHVVATLEEAKRPLPEGDPVLVRVARRLAKEALEANSAKSADLLTIAHVSSEEGGWDPPPEALIVQGSPPELMLQSFLARRSFAERPATHLGVGAAGAGRRAAMAVLLTRRRVNLAPFARRHERAGVRAPLCGTLLAPYEHPAVFVTGPSGRVGRLELTVEEGPRFCAEVSFDDPGEYAVEVVGEGPRGPEVAALFFVPVGKGTERSKSPWEEEPKTLPEARRALIARVNALRRAHGLVEVGEDTILSRIAQEYGAQVAKEGALVHQTQEGRGLASRLYVADYSYEVVAENLATASGPLAAHFALEMSPGHRQSLIDPRFDRIGVGVTWKSDPKGTRVYITELMVSSPRQAQVKVSPGDFRVPRQLMLRSGEERPPEDPVAQLVAAVNAARKERGLKEVTRGPALDAIAAGQVDEVRGGRAPRLADHDRVFARSHGEGEVSVFLWTQEQAVEAKALLGTGALRVGIAYVGEELGFVVVLSGGR